MNNLSFIFTLPVDLMDYIESFFLRHPYCSLLRKKWIGDLRNAWLNPVWSLRCQFSQGLKGIKVLYIQPTLCFYFNSFITYGLEGNAYAHAQEIRLDGAGL